MSSLELAPFSNLPVLPVVVSLGFGILLVLGHGHLRYQRAAGALGVVAALAVDLWLFVLVLQGGPLVYRAGDWPAPYGILFVADRLNVLMALAAGVVAFFAFAFALRSVDEERQRAFFFPLFQFQMAGVYGAFLTGDLFNLFVFFEVTLLASYVLLTLGGGRLQLQEGLKYIAINIVASTLFLVGVAVLYRTLGTVNMADLAVKVAAATDRGWILVIAVVFMAVFGIKAAIFPLYFWLPYSYFTPPTAIVGLFAGLLSKVGIYALYRVFTLIFVGNVAVTHQVLFLVLASFTMFLGVVGPVAQMDFKRILAFHIVSQIGYMLMGLGFYTPLALAGGIFHIVHNMMIKSGLFLTAGATELVTGTTHLEKMSGVLKSHPFLASIFFLSGLSLAGIPPFSGFFSKVALMLGGLRAGGYLVVAVSVVVSFLTLFSMIKIWRYAYWGPSTGERQVGSEATAGLVWPAVGMLLISVAMGVGAAYVLDYTYATALELMQPARYVGAVLGPQAAGVLVSGRF
ncbi:proton-conducting transporter transmembrane domain-containing protein [Limnochorda pilosa]|uniref:Na+/H+ antiporter n=1 Tax=Limnochorda pilosa TaxID=1555112 RepID=A0A0K2SLI5_LIMPI|nr:proton-conducting transporter membrane subunit [Limnochorda pilosa]BAS27679.1 Na+/H+ antiporter [Limnochorda pilosa]